MLREGSEPIKGYMHVIQKTSSRSFSIKAARALEHGSSKILLHFLWDSRHVGLIAQPPNRPLDARYAR